MARPGSLSNFIRQLAGPNPRKNGVNKNNPPKKARNINKEPVPIEEPNPEKVETPFYFGPDPNYGIPFGPMPEENFVGYGIFEEPQPLTEAENISDAEKISGNEDESLQEENEDRGYSIF